jgi:hypothetical protein
MSRIESIKDWITIAMALSSMVPLRNTMAVKRRRHGAPFCEV